MKTLATVTSKGQVTLPKAIREALGIRAGDVIEFEFRKGKLAVRHAKPAGFTAGMLKNRLPPDWKAPTVEEMNEAVRKAVSDHVMASLR